MANFMLTNDLVDPGFIGPSFTWTNNKDARSRIFNRLDRFLMSSSIIDVFQGLKVKHLTRLASDHCPILCCLVEDVKKACYYWIKFEDVWASYPFAWHLVGEKWKVEDLGSESFKLQRKCQRSLKALFFWSKNKLKSLNQLKEDLDKEIKILQEIECGSSGLSEVQEEALRYKVKLLNNILTRIMTWWRQRAKVLWMEQGDGNTYFFHSMASARRRSKSIDSIKLDDGSLISEQGDGQSIVEDGWPSLEFHRSCVAEFKDFLEGDVTEEEIWSVICSLGRNK
ncbi:uncharacterized protein LOC110115767, partial [Dendrobium catenatum]|uniref:uncharacterized protein LOC110115767 n=1 Tax=Dendrobium catenatum TaxID=906689 RepID=UPI0009F268CC